MTVPVTHFVKRKLGLCRETKQTRVLANKLGNRDSTANKQASEKTTNQARKHTLAI